MSTKTKKPMHGHRHAQGDAHAQPHQARADARVGGTKLASTDLNGTLWLQFMQSLTKTVNLPGATQAIYPFLTWDWGGQSTLQSMPFAQYQVLDVVPTAPINNTNTAQSAQGFGETYLLWLQAALNPIPGQTDPQYQKLQQAVQVAAGNLQSANSTALAAYKNFVGSTGSAETYSAWLANEGAPNAAQVQLDQGTLSTAQSAVAAYLKSRSGPVTTATAQYASNLVSVANQSGQMVTVPGWFTSSTAYGHVLDITNQNFGGSATNGNANTVQFTQDTQSYDYSSAYGSSESETDLFFVSVYSENSWSQVDLSTFSSSYEVSFSFEDLTTIAVSPGQWYDSGLPAVLGTNGPYNEGFSGFENGSDTYFFGQGGELARQITSMVVGYRPTLTISAGTAFTTFMQQQSSSSEGIQVGPFFVSTSSSSSFGQAGSMSATGDTITVTGNGDWPSILAFASEWTVAPKS